MGVVSSKYLRGIIFGKPDQPGYDGIHLIGAAASRHFTYRAIQSMKQIFAGKSSRPVSEQGADGLQSAGNNCPTQPDDYHKTSCPQAVYQRRKTGTNQSAKTPTGSQSEQHQSGESSQARMYSDVVNGKYSVPTQNRFNPLN